MFNRIQKRCASVLTALPPSPNTTTSHSLHLPYIITPVTEPLTATSNNAFNPNYIPKNTKERLLLQELAQVLDNSKHMYKLLQAKYLQDEETIEDLKELLEEHYRLLEALKKK